MGLGQSLPASAKVFTAAGPEFRGLPGEAGPLPGQLFPATHTAAHCGCVAWHRGRLRRKQEHQLHL